MEKSSARPQQHSELHQEQDPDGGYDGGGFIRRRPGQVIKLTLKVLSRHKSVLKDPAPQVAVKEWGDSSVNLVVRPWAKTEDYWDVYFDIKKTLKQIYDKAGISIPYPQRDIHIIDSNPPPKKNKKK